MVAGDQCGVRGVRRVPVQVKGGQDAGQLQPTLTKVMDLGSERMLVYRVSYDCTGGEG